MKHKVAATKYRCVLCLRACGFGMTRITRRLQMGKASVSRVFQANGIAIDPERNGRALKGTGIAYRKPFKRVLISMRSRVRKCLSRTAPRIPTFPAHWTEAEIERWKYQNRIEYRLRCVLRRRIRKVIEVGVKSGSSIDLLGCSTEQFKRHIEDQFELGMSWDNYGQWQLDHRRPCASFDLTLPSHQRRCFHFKNYRPLWRIENARKNSLWHGVRHGRRRSGSPGPVSVKKSLTQVPKWPNLAVSDEA
ncbi:MAG: hypothetical protein QOI07_936 [Verrucomicrobiota bacterium]|jgi:hypothetical protein